MDAVSEKILIIGPAWIGDMIMAQSLFITLKQRFPNCLIDVLAPAWTEPLLARMPEINQSIGIRFKHGQFGLFERIKIANKLRRHGYTQAIILPNSWKSALIPFFAGIPRRSGYLGEMRRGLLNDVYALDKQRLKMTVQRFVALAYPKYPPSAPVCPRPRIMTSPALQAEAAGKFGVGRSSMLALCPGAEFGPAKRWPAAHFAEVALEKYRQGWQVCLFGSEKDRTVAESINTLTGGVCLNFAGKTRLHEVVDLLALADVVVSNDSGLMHVAAALDKKLIAIYGSSDPGFTPPLHDKAVILRIAMACAPCFERVCPLGHTRCLAEISPASVLAAIEA
ncbi:MAG: lipopolysaccharide heptosyltransferase II [Methylomonas sp.]